MRALPPVDNVTTGTAHPGMPSGKETLMPRIEIEILAPFAAKFMEGSTLTPAERAEVLRMAQGFACKDSASAADVSPETIRARRKRIYRKLDMTGSNGLISALLATSLQMLATGERLEPRAAAPAQPAAGASPLGAAR